MLGLAASTGASLRTAPRSCTIARAWIDLGHHNREAPAGAAGYLERIRAMGANCHPAHVGRTDTVGVESVIRHTVYSMFPGARGSIKNYRNAQVGTRIDAKGWGD